MNAITEKILHDVQELPDDFQQETLDFVQFLSSKRKKQQLHSESNKEKIALILDRITTRNSELSKIKDPVSWQKNNRMDRDLPFGKK